MRLRAKLLLMLIPLVVGSLVAIAGAAYVQLRSTAERNYLQQMDTLLDQIALQFEAKVRTAQANTELFAASYLLEKYALIEDEAERYRLLQRPLLRAFASYQRAYPDYYEVRYLLPDGYEAVRRVDGQVPNLTETEGQTALFQRLAAAGDSVYTEVAVNPDNGEVALYAGKPLRLRDPTVDPILAEPLLRGYLIITVRLTQLAQQLASPHFGKDGILFVTDASGQPLVQDSSARQVSASPGEDMRPPPGELDRQLLRQAIDRPQLTHLPWLGQTVHLHVRELHPGLYLYGALPQQAVQEITSTLGRIVIGITVLSMITFAGALFIALRRLVLQPLHRLQNVAQQIGRGQLDVDIACSGRDEMASLAQSFSAMARSLAESNNQVRFLAEHDSLTGLPNRRLFQDYLGKALAHAQRNGERLALLFLDVDEFKNVNDTLGHHAGDELLQQFAECLLGVVRAEDTIGRALPMPGEMVARLGGDEFTILLAGLSEPTTAARVAQRILTRLEQPFVIGRQQFFIGASIGITVFPDDGASVADLVKHADLAMYHAKRCGKNNYQFFAAGMNTAAMQRMHMEQRLRRALERKEFTLHFQPIVELASNRIVGAEALLRWHDTENDCLVRPDEFIPAAEASGLIIPLGEWVLEEACTIARDWQERGLPPIKVAVNVSTMQLERSALTQITRDILLATGLEAARLELELTETVVMSLSAEVKEDLKSLQALGVSIALDDFGMGYSSLNYLRHLPIDKLKIDRSFVHGCVEQADQRSIIVAIIALAHALGYSVVGEGIETTQELGLLRQQGCDLGQGFLFSRPLTADRFADLVQSWDADSARPRLAHY